jgi:hypothetical protein
MTEAMTSPDPARVNVWRAQALRFTVFKETPTDPEKTDWWAEVVGQPPENRIERVRERVLQDSGSLPDEPAESLILKIESEKIDWILQRTPAETDDESDLHTHTLGTFDEAITRFRVALDRWIPNMPAVRRLAFGADVLQHATDHNAAYKLLNDYLLFDVNGTATDLLFRINRKVASRVLTDTQINRLATWSAVNFQAARLSTAARVAPGLHFLFTACRLQLDINTEANRDLPIEPDQIPLVLDELVGHARMIAAEGDQG